MLSAQVVTNTLLVDAVEKHLLKTQARGAKKDIISTELASLPLK